MDEDVVHIYNGILLSHKKGGIMPSAATWMQLDIIILNEMSEKERQIPCDITYEWDLNNAQMNLHVNRNRIDWLLPREGS